MGHIEVGFFLPNHNLDLGYIICQGKMTTFLHTVSEQWWCQKSDHTGNHVTIKVKPKSTYYMDVFDFKMQ